MTTSISSEAQKLWMDMREMIHYREVEMYIKLDIINYKTFKI